MELIFRILTTRVKRLITFIECIIKKSCVSLLVFLSDYVASYAFTGTEPGDLSFNAGDVISVTSTDGEWWTGSLNGKTGIFPANYVTVHKTVSLYRIAFGNTYSFGAFSRIKMFFVSVPYTSNPRGGVANQIWIMRPFTVGREKFKFTF